MKILVPVDLSSVSTNALKYAYDAFPGAEIHVVHAVTGLLNPNDPMVIKPWIQKDMSIKEDIQNLIRSEFAGSDYSQDVPVEILFGEVVPAIGRFLKNNSFDAVVMGTRDKYDLLDRWIGTNSLGVIKTVDLPIYLIPKFGSFRGWSKVLVATDRKIAKPKMIEFIRHWNVNNAFLKFVHVQESRDHGFNEEEQQIFESLFEEGEPSFGFEVKVIEDPKVGEPLLTMAYREKADLILVVPEKQSFFQAVFFQSFSKELVENSYVPMLFLSEESVNALTGVKTVDKQEQNNMEL